MWRQWLSGRAEKYLFWFGLALAAPVFLYFGAIYVRSLTPRGTCPISDEIVSRNTAGYLINYHLEVCGTPAASATISLQLLRNAKGQPAKFISYAGSEPYIRWISGRRVLVTIFDIEEVYQESSDIGDIHFSYNIGTKYENGQSLYAECNPPNGPTQQRCLEYVDAMMQETNDQYCGGPLTIDLQTIVSVVRLWIRENPKDVSRPASDTVKHAIKQAFPCLRFPGA